MGFRRSIAATSLVLGVLGVLASPRAHAQVAEADAQFARGKQLMEEDKLDDACEAFETSNRIDPRAGTLIWIGECRARNHQLASAHAAYKEALVRVKDPRKRAIATSKLAAVEDKLSYLLVVVAEDRRLAGLTLTRDGQPLDVEGWNRGLPIDGGDYAITASAPGHAPWTTTVTVPAELGRIRVEVPALEALARPAVPERVPPLTAAAITAARPGDVPLPDPGAPSPATPTPASPTPASPTAPPTDASAGRARDAGPPSPWTQQRKLALGVLAGSAAAWATGAVLGIQARSDEHDALALCPGAETSCGNARRANQLLDEGSHRALGANIAFAVAAAMTVGAGVLWFTGAPESPRHLALVPIVAPGIAGAMVCGRL